MKNTLKVNALQVSSDVFELMIKFRRFDKQDKLSFLAIICKYIEHNLDNEEKGILCEVIKLIKEVEEEK